MASGQWSVVSGQFGGCSSLLNWPLTTGNWPLFLRMRPLDAEIELLLRVGFALRIELFEE